ncbi:MULTISPECIES: DUF4249 family protein [Sphingobacterium]|uniref:DUF4249 domain-containing protein n=1 Tax=Sphingobacterium litopenaei TaxID=2763500 RepID=A0ABR7YAT3_9SPHI|nr:MULTISPECIES: DUF4249 family protein [Sphingobacterium]MBD1428429.1 DUF4249 domain-containing protein [Sphingobacterium litopenaei]NGM71767.1 DUF4249 domain-containing protein [Sphingobacterium sp. SGL-16]
MRFLYIYSLLTLFVLSSCEELIQVNLNEANPKYVIEGDLNDLSSEQFIRVSQTVAFDAPVRSKPIDNATVTVSDDKGKVYTFNSVGNGLYKSSFQPKAKTRYNLKVSVEGEVFESSSYMNSYVDVDSLGIMEDVIFSDTVYSVTLKFEDPRNTPNYYKYNISVNGKDFEFSRVFSDKFNDGLYVTHQVSDSKSEILLGDTVVVERQIIDKPVFNYWNEVLSINPGSAAPANPTSNITNGALGYFSVSSAKRYGFRIKFKEEGN